MKNEIRLALICMAAASVPAFAQNATPLCGSTNFDKTLNGFSIREAPAGTVNQQCFITVYPAGAVPADAWKSPGSYIVEGTYEIELVGGGGGGGGGGTHAQGGGGGGAGAAPSKTVQYLAPGVYKMTIGTGGYGGAAMGGRTGSGNPTSLTNVYTGALVAGFPGADTWTQGSQRAGSGAGGIGLPGGSSGGSGADAGDRSDPKSNEAAQAGSASATPGYYAVAGQAGGESARSARADKDAGIVVQPDAGGGGGASIGSGATGGSPRVGSVAQQGGQGGNGLIRLTLTKAAPVAMARAAPARTMQNYSASTDALFAFGKYALRPQGEAKLDELLSKIKDTKVENITVTGHADRFGTDEYNQTLSENRAETVKAYLANKGIQSDRMVVTGKGESQPVTNADDCMGPKSAKVIACLQPDRRVDIDVAAAK